MMSPPFVAREHELAGLQRYLDHTVAGHGQVVFIAGESGSGKTALLREVARRAQDSHADLVVAVGECNAQTGIGDPFLPWREILNEMAGDVDAKLAQGAISQQGAERLRGLVGVSAEALVELGPSLINLFVPGSALLTQAGRFVAKKAGWLKPLQQLAERKPSAPGDTSLDQNRIFEQYTNVLKAIAARQPLLLVVDDLHWADAASISLLFHLARRVGESRILIVGAYRPSEVALGRSGERHPLEKVLSELKRYSGDMVIDLSQAEDDEGRRFVDALLDSEANDLGQDFRDALFSQTGGQALFVVELLHMLQERGDLRKDEQGRWVQGPALDWTALPERVEGVIEERIGGLEDDLRQTLRVASVEGKSFTAEVVARVQEVRELQLLRSLSQELEKKHRLVHERGAVKLARHVISRYEFAHALFQRYMYNDVSAGEKRLLHGAVARVLEELYAGSLDDVTVQLARHYAEAGDDEKAIEYLLKAGDRARSLYANQEAIGHYRGALALYEADPLPARTALALQLYEGLGDVCSLVGQHDQACDAYTQALSRTSSDDFLQKPRLNRKLGSSWSMRNFDKALGYFALAETSLGPAPAIMTRDWRHEWLEIHLDVVWTHFQAGHVKQMADLARQAQPIVKTQGTPSQRARFFHNVTLMAFLRDHWLASDETLANAQAGLAASRECGDTTRMVNAMHQVAFCHLLRNELDDAEQGLQASLKLAEQIGYVLRQASSLAYLTVICRKRGQADLVKHYAARSRAAAVAAQAPIYIAEAEGHLAWVAWREGRLADARKLAGAALERQSTITSYALAAGMAFWPLLAVALAQGQVAEAIGCARRLLDPALLRLPEALEAPLSAAVAAWDAGQADGAHAYLSRAVALAPEGGYL